MLFLHGLHDILEGHHLPEVHVADSSPVLFPRGFGEALGSMSHRRLRESINGLVRCHFRAQGDVARLDGAQTWMWWAVWKPASRLAQPKALKICESSAWAIILGHGWKATQCLPERLQRGSQTELASTERRTRAEANRHPSMPC